MVRIERAAQLLCRCGSNMHRSRRATGESDPHLIMRHAVVRQHADQDQRVGAAVVLDDVDVGVNVKHLLQSLRRMPSAVAECANGCANLC